VILRKGIFPQKEIVILKKIILTLFILNSCNGKYQVKRVEGDFWNRVNYMWYKIIIDKKFDNRYLIFNKSLHLISNRSLINEFGCV